MISGEDLIGLTEFGKIKLITNIFQDSYRSPVSLLVIDDIERLLEYVHVGSRFSNNILQCFLTYLKRLPITIGHKLIIIGTTSSPDVLKELGLWSCFNLKLPIPLLHANGEIQNALRQMIPGADLSSLHLDKKYQIPIKSLYFIANVINQKLSQNPKADIDQIFLNVLSQTEIY
jgi:vesicle-fusing ATPase